MALLPAMRAPRVAAVAPVTAPAQETFLTRHGRARAEPRWTAEQANWEAAARAYAQFNGPAAFNALVISDMCARCVLRVEERDPSGDWVPTERPELLYVLDEYANRWQNSADLVRAHAWRYNVDGHAFLCLWDGDFGLEYGVFSPTRVELHKPQKGLVTIQLVKGGRVDDGTALAIPIEQVFHVWIPSPEELLRPTSPMQASIEDLHRYRALTRYAWRTAESRLAMEGLLWAPSDIIRDDGSPSEPGDEQADDIGTATNAVEDQYYELAKLRTNDNDDITAIAPPFVTWDKELGPPEWIKVGEGLDQAGIEHRREAIEDAARPWPVPTTALMGGGVGDANHWSEWLASEKFVESGVQPNMDRICHMDLTRTFLWTRLRFEGYAPDALRSFRVGYDTAPIVVRPDRSDLALKALAAGAIGFEPAREACGWDEDDAPTDDDLDLLFQVLSKGAQGEGEELPAAESNVAPGPPSTTLAPSANGNGSASSEPVALAAVLGAILDGPHSS